MIEEPEGGGASETTDPASGTSAATDVALKEFIELDHKWLWRFLQERDRRYTEVQHERDKAEVIARETQTYKDMKANELREQIPAERGRYVTQNELTGAVNEIKAILEPVVEFVHGQRGSRQGSLDLRQMIAWGIAAVLGLLALGQALM